MAVSGAVNFKFPFVLSITGLPIKMKINEGKKVKKRHVTGRHHA